MVLEVVVIPIPVQPCGDVCVFGVFGCRSLCALVEIFYRNKSPEFDPALCKLVIDLSSCKSSMIVLLQAVVVASLRSGKRLHATFSPLTWDWTQELWKTHRNFNIE